MGGGNNWGKTRKDEVKDAGCLKVIIKLLATTVVLGLLDCRGQSQCKGCENILRAM